MGLVALKQAKPAPSKNDRETYIKIFENSKDSVFLISGEDQKIVFANAQAIETTSYEAEEFLGMDFKSLFLPEEQDAIKTLLETTLQWKTGIDPQRHLKRKTGRKVIVEISTSVTEFESKPTIFCTVRDITARIKAEEKIKKYSEELEKMNAELEDRVKQRTQSLAKANDALKETNLLIEKQKRELDDVMSNIQQAIFTVSPKFTINPEFSKFVSTVFGFKTVAGAKVAHFLYGSDTSDEAKLINDGLGTAFNSPDTWNMIRDLLPRELKYKRPSEKEAEEERDIVIEWCPIILDGKLIKVMVICQDITEQKKLQEAIAKKEKEHNEQLELISQLISLPTETVEQFVKDSKRLLAEGEADLIKLKEAPNSELLNSFMRSVHTIKGSSRQFRLSSIQEIAHELENRAVKWIKTDAKDLKNEIDLTITEFDNLKNSFQDVYTFYEKTVHGKGSDNGEEVLQVPIRKIDQLLDFIPNQGEKISSSDLTKSIRWLRTVPVRSLFDRLENLAFSLAEEFGKKVEIKRIGDDLEVDFKLFTPLYDAFLHVIRNMLDHGAETPDERTAAGKGQEVNLVFSAFLFKRNYIIFEFIDDGRGVDLKKVIRRILERKMATPEEIKDSTKERVLQYIFEPGFSTKDEATEISGRGVGMDMVKEVVEKSLGGKVVMHSDSGKGTRLVSVLPIENEKKDYNFKYLLSQKNDKTIAWDDLGLKKMSGENDTYDAVLVDSENLAAVSPNESNRNRIVCLDQMSSENWVKKVINPYRIQHFFDRSNPLFLQQIRTCLHQIRSKSAPSIDKFLTPGSFIQSVKLKDFSKKATVLEEVSKYCDGLPVFSNFAQTICTIGDEMIMNAMFDAPRDENGKEKYNHLPRTHKLILEDNEIATLRYGHDENVFAISIEDPFGALKYETLANYLKKCFEKSDNQIDRKPGGAGLGLYTIFNEAHYFIASVNPGVRTEFIALVFISKSFLSYQKIGKSFSYFLKSNE